MADIDPEKTNDQIQLPSSNPTIQQNRITVRKRDWNFDDCQHAIQTIPTTNAGVVELNYGTGPGKPTFTGEDPVTASTTVEHSLINATITLKVPKWPDMTAAEEAARDDFVNDLEIHERGHILVGDTVAAAFSTEFSAEGRTRGEAMRKLREKARQRQRKAESELERLAGSGGRYDQVTDHGKTQSRGPTETYTVRGIEDETLATDTFPGGDNVVLHCEPCEDTVQLSNGIHHLGDGNYNGAINCCFQTGVEGEELQITFETEECQAKASAAEVVYTHRGVQADNPIRINGTQIGTTPGSPSDGSTTVGRLSFNPSLLQAGANVFEVTAVGPRTSDVDDFELSDIRLEFTID